MQGKKPIRNKKNPKLLLTGKKGLTLLQKPIKQRNDLL
jgi:hypothetical protein